MCKTGLHPLYVNVELITPDHHVVSRHDELWQWCILRENTCTLKFSERSSYNATAVLSKIRCIKDKHHMQSKYVTWYGHHHLMLMISITEASSWSPTSPAQHLDLHRSIVVVLPSLLLRLSLPLSDKVKHYIAIALHTIKRQPYGSCQLPITRLQNMIISYNKI